jgi:tape measure domain-containing protein
MSTLVDVAEFGFGIDSREAERGAQRATSALQSIEDHADKLMREINRLNNLLKSATLYQQFSGAMREAESAFDRFVAKVKSGAGSLSSVFSSLKSGAGGILSTIVGVAGGGLIGGAISSVFSGLTGALKGVIETGIDFNETVESAQISLKRLLGSASAAQQEIEKLKKQSLIAPVGFEQLLKLDQQLLNVGFSAKTTSQDLTSFSQGLGLITSTKGLDARLERVVTQLVQMATKGRAANDELTTLAENNIPVYDLLGKAFKTTGAEVFKLAESGQLKGLETAQLLLLQIGQEAKKVGPELNESFAVLRSNLDDLTQQAAGRGTQNLFGGLKDALKLATSDQAQGILNSIAGGADKLTGTLLDGIRGSLNAISSGNFLDVGRQIVTGLADGISSTAQSAWDKAKELGGGILDTVKKVLDIQSPSKKMQELGIYAADGFIDGLVDRTSEGFKRWAAQIEKIGGEELIRAVEKIARRRGANPNDLLGVFGFESGLDPSRTNKIGATGLIQFLPSTARALGTTTDALRKQTAIEQLEYVDKYLAQFDKVLDTTEKLYSAVLRGKVLNDPETVLFTKGTKAYAQNPLDFDKSGTVTLSEATSQIRKQGFTTPGRGGILVKDDVQVVTNIKAQLDAIPFNLDKINTGLDHIPPGLRTVNGQLNAATGASQQFAQATDDVNARIAKLAQTARQNPLVEEIKKTQKAIDDIGQFLPEKQQLAQLEAIKKLKQAEEDAVLRQIGLRAELANKTVYSSQRANAAVLEHLNREVRGVTDIVATAKTGIIDTVFGGADRAIDKLTDKLGLFKGVVADILRSLARLALSPLLAGLAGGGRAAALGTSSLSLGGFATSTFAPGGAVPGVTSGSGGVSIGGFSLGGLRNIFSHIPGIGGLFGSRSLITSPIPGATGTLSTVTSAQAGIPTTLDYTTPLAKAAGASAAPSALASLGASGLLLGGGLLGQLAGGKSPIGRLLGGLGGTLGLGAIAAHGIFGGAISGALPALFSNPITAIIAGGLIGGALLFNHFSNGTEKALGRLIQSEYGLRTELEIQKQVKAIGDQYFNGNGGAKKHELETIKLQQAKELLYSYALQSGQTNSRLVKDFEFERTLGDPYAAANRIIKRHSGGAVVPFQDYLVRREEVVRFDQPGQVYPSMADYLARAGSNDIQHQVMAEMRQTLKLLLMNVADNTQAITQLRGIKPGHVLAMGVADAPHVLATGVNQAFESNTPAMTEFQRQNGF